MKITYEKIIKILEEKNIDITDYSTVGWRADDLKRNIGDEVDSSRDFEGRNLDEAIENDEIIDTLPGASTYGLTVYGETDTSLINEWAGTSTDDFFNDTNFYIIGGSDAGYGTDAGERVIADATVLAVIQ